MANENEPKTFEQAVERYLEYQTRFERLENEFDEYQQSSLNYEQELEVQLKENENQIRRLQQDLFLERTQNEQYRERTEQTIKQFNQQFDKIQEEFHTCQNLNIKLTQYIRELEQTNDDLERSQRTLLDSLSTFETKLNQALEQNALLENELDDKRQLTETVQRLRDETRDLREELDVLHKTNKETVVESNAPRIANSHRMQSILIEAAAEAAATSSSSSTCCDSNIRPSLSNGDYQSNPSMSKQQQQQRTNELPLSNVNDSSQPLSTSTRLESLKLITETFRRFANIETTLSAQRKQSQTVIRTRFNPKTNECVLSQTQS